MRKACLALLFLMAAGLSASAQTTTPTLTKKPLTVTVRAAATPAASGTSSFVFNWSYTPNLQACTSTLKACYDGFVLTNTTTGTIVGTTSQIVPTALSYTYTPVGGVPFGSTSFSLVAHGFTEAGAELVSNAATVTAVVKVTSLNGPSNLQAIAQ